MSETSRRPSAEFPASEAPKDDAEKGAEILPIRPDVVIPAAPERNAAPEKEKKEVLDEIKAVNRKIFELRRDNEALGEGLAEDADEAGRQILTATWFSRISGWFAKKKPKPLQYDAETRSDLVRTSVDIRQQVDGLKQRRRELAERLDEATRRKLEEDWLTLDRIYRDLRHPE